VRGGRLGAVAAARNGATSVVLYSLFFLFLLTFAFGSLSVNTGNKQHGRSVFLFFNFSHIPLPLSS
jgi:hypothetical protein